jgi:hypothetical protein
MRKCHKHQRSIAVARRCALDPGSPAATKPPLKTNSWNPRLLAMIALGLAVFPPLLAMPEGRTQTQAIL